MGTGSSKSKQKGKVVVAAEVVVEGQSQPIKVKGQVNLSENAGQQKGPAMVKQVAPNTYSLQMGSQSIGVSFFPLFFSKRFKPLARNIFSQSIMVFFFRSTFFPIL